MELALLQLPCVVIAGIAFLVAKPDSGAIRRRKCSPHEHDLTIMPHSRRMKLPPVPTWTCPHCDFVHRPADLLRLDSDLLQCKACKQPFDSTPDGIKRKDSEP